MGSPLKDPVMQGVFLCHDFILFNACVAPFACYFTLGKIWLPTHAFITLRLRQNGHHLQDDIFKCIFFNEDVWISSKISLKFLPKGRIYKMRALVQIMAWRLTGHYLNQWCPMLPMHICITLPQWVSSMLHIFCHLKVWSIFYLCNYCSVFNMCYNISAITTPAVCLKKWQHHFLTWLYQYIFSN